MKDTCAADTTAAGNRSDYARPALRMAATVQELLQAEEGHDSAGDRHLGDVLGRVDAEGFVRVVGLGVGLDLSGFSRRGHVLDLDRPVDRRLARALGPS